MLRVFERFDGSYEDESLSEEEMCVGKFPYLKGRGVSHLGNKSR